MPRHTSKQPPKKPESGNRRKGRPPKNPAPVQPNSAPGDDGHISDFSDAGGLEDQDERTSHEVEQVAELPGAEDAGRPLSANARHDVIKFTYGTPETEWKNLSTVEVAEKFFRPINATHSVCKSCTKPVKGKNVTDLVRYQTRHMAQNHLVIPMENRRSWHMYPYDLLVEHFLGPKTKEGTKHYHDCKVCPNRYYGQSVGRILQQHVFTDHQAVADWNIVGSPANNIDTLHYLTKCPDLSWKDLYMKTFYIAVDHAVVFASKIGGARGRGGPIKDAERLPLALHSVIDCIDGKVTLNWKECDILLYSDAVIGDYPVQSDYPGKLLVKYEVLLLMIPHLSKLMDSGGKVGLSERSKFREVYFGDDPDEGLKDVRIAEAIVDHKIHPFAKEARNFCVPFQLGNLQSQNAEWSCLCCGLKFIGRTYDDHIRDYHPEFQSRPSSLKHYCLDESIAATYDMTTPIDSTEAGCSFIIVKCRREGCCFTRPIVMVGAINAGYSHQKGFIRHLWHHVDHHEAAGEPPSAPPFCLDDATIPEFSRNTMKRMIASPNFTPKKIISHQNYSVGRNNEYGESTILYIGLSGDGEPITGQLCLDPHFFRHLPDPPIGPNDDTKIIRSLPANEWYHVSVGPFDPEKFISQMRSWQLANPGVYSLLTDWDNNWTYGNTGTRVADLFSGGVYIMNAKPDDPALVGAERADNWSRTERFSPPYKIMNHLLPTVIDEELQLALRRYARIAGGLTADHLRTLLHVKCLCEAIYKALARTGSSIKAGFRLFFDKEGLPRLPVIPEAEDEFPLEAGPPAQDPDIQVIPGTPDPPPVDVQQAAAGPPSVHQNRVPAVPENIKKRKHFMGGNIPK